MSYIEARLNQWAEYVTGGTLVSIGFKRCGCGDIKLYRQEVEAERLTWVKRTHRAVLSLEPEFRNLIYLRYLFLWRVKAIAERYAMSESTVSRRLQMARYVIANYFEEQDGDI